MKSINVNEYDRIGEATLIWHYSNGLSKEKGDIRWACIDLYRTTSGEYLLHVSGGPGSGYAGRENTSSVWGDGVIYSDGEGIIPMSLQDLMIWGEECLPEDIFGIILQDIRKKTQQENTGTPKILEISEQKLAMREKEIKTCCAAAQANAEVQARQTRFYEQFVEL